LERPDRREWLMLALPLACFLALAWLLSWLAYRVLREFAPGLGAWPRGVASTTLGLAFVLDPEAQHLAIGGLTEAPFTLGLVIACGALATGWAAHRPLAFGLLLGVTGLFRGNMLWFAPLFAIAAAASATPGRRRWPFVRVLSGYGLLLAPWWLHKAMSFGSPAWDLSALGLWDGVGGRNWLTLTHLPQMPELPSLSASLPLLIEKLSRNVASVGPSLVTGWRAVPVGALLVWIAFGRGAPRLRITAIAIAAATALSLVVAALGASWLRYLFPMRVPLEAAGLLALFALIARIPDAMLRASARRLIHAAIAVTALAWGVQQTRRGNLEAREVAATRALPGVATLNQLADRIVREVPAEEPVMSNLGSTLAWYADRPIVHLALTPNDVNACRDRLEFRHVLVVFPDSARSWPGWGEIVARPQLAAEHPGWSTREVRHWLTSEGLRAVWIELGPRATSLP
ncbi:MAG: hypothetical protein HOP12_05880, partial [Candidatus Eisenbacteria bacterium]|nr:hypothetical protein [Candidatus Eisenbacteria bacterium]